MIIKSFNLSDIKKTENKIFLLFGENEGQKDDVVKNYFLSNFKGEIIRYDENQILENKINFFETCLNESLFDDEKIIIVSRVTAKLYDTIEEINKKKIIKKKIIFNSGALEKKSKIRQIFEKEKNLVCIAFYQDNFSTLYKIASDFFKFNKISISSENINMIIDKSMGDRKNLKNEMNKILNYCLDKRKISRNEISKLINFNGDDNYFELIDNCLSKNYIKVGKIINNNNFSKNDSIILIRSFLSRLKRLIELKKLQMELTGSKETVENFKPPIFWKDKQIVQKHIEIWPIDKVYALINEVNNLEIKYKKNSQFSNNLIFDLILNTSNN
tara:strand:+ start:6353 stop:7339 length:987 start_codon:yes stop_codon:yes gene_type:complete